MFRFYGEEIGVPGDNKKEMESLGHSKNNCRNGIHFILKFVWNVLI
jgi:hypothetical protein